jgi:hypothetical protein
MRANRTVDCDRLAASEARRTLLFVLAVLAAVWAPTAAAGADDATSADRNVCATVVTVTPVSPTTCPAIPTVCPPVGTQCPTVTTTCSAVGKCADGKPQRVLIISIDEGFMLTHCPRQVTRCPIFHTKCRANMKTHCPEVSTVCPGGETKCPAVSTQCPAGDTYCPERNTKCPTAETKCPVSKTLCPVQETKCPGGETKCTGGVTRCPIADTQCPASQTKCPSDETKCPAEDTKCPAEPGRCGARTPLTLIVKDPSGKPAEGAKVLVWQPGVKSMVLTADAAGTAVAKDVLAGAPVRIYSVAADRKSAAETVLTSADAAKKTPTEIRLLPARACRIVIEDEGGAALAGLVKVYIVCPRAADSMRMIEEDRDCRLIARLEAAPPDKAVSVEGLLPGVKYLVRGAVNGYESARPDPWVELTFGEADASPRLTLKFRRESTGG